MSASLRVLSLGAGVQITAAGDSEDFPVAVHAPTGAGHVLVTIEPSEFWKAMPATAVRAEVGQHLTRHAATLRAAGYGVDTWEHRGATAVLIVAATPAAAADQAPAVRAHLAALNPAPGQEP